LQTEEVGALIANAGLDDAVEVVVSPNNQALRDLMRRSSFFASASEYEGFGISAIEGMSAGLFPILSDIPSFRRLIERTGLGMTLDYAVPDESARLLLDNVSKIASCYSGQRAACVRAANTYDWPSVCRAYSTFYDAAIGATERTILDVPVQVLTFEQAADLIDTRYARGEPFAVAFANAHTLNVAVENVKFRRALQNSLVLNDGIGIDLASRWLYGVPFPENLNGTDFVPNFLRATRHRYRIFLLGARPGTAGRAAERLAHLCPQHEFVGCHHGFMDDDSAKEVAALVRRSKADVLLVALGNPKQEFFLQEHMTSTGCTLGIGVGALFDFLAGNVPRAAQWVRRWHLEWVYRLGHEPGRLAHRYLLGNPLYLARIARQFWSGARISFVEPEPSGKYVSRSPAKGAQRDFALRKPYRCENLQITDCER
jgi:alpha-1,3-mannosyltransferase